MKSDETMMRIEGAGVDTGWISAERLERAAERVAGRSGQQALPGLNEPQELTEEERAEARDQERRELLTEGQLSWQSKARMHLTGEGAVVETARRSRKTRLKLAVVYRHAGEGCACAATLTLTYESRDLQVADSALARYLSELAAYEGLPCEVAEQICHDLYTVLHPSTIKVQLVSKLHGVERTEEEEMSWPW